MNYQKFIKLFPKLSLTVPEVTVSPRCHQKEDFILKAK